MRLNPPKMEVSPLRSRLARAIRTQRACFTYRPYDLRPKGLDKPTNCHVKSNFLCGDWWWSREYFTVFNIAFHAESVPRSFPLGNTFCQYYGVFINRGSFRFRRKTGGPLFFVETFVDRRVLWWFYDLFDVCFRKLSTV